MYKRTFEINQFPWYQKGLKQLTTVEVIVADNSLNLKVTAKDIHSNARRRRINDAVYLDSCFEFFFAPSISHRESYLNLEVNCVGNYYFAHSKANSGEIQVLKLSDERHWKAIQIKSDFLNGVKNVTNEDCHWHLTISVPRWVIEDMWGAPLGDNEWYGNFYRCGGEIDPQYASWQPIVFPVPSFHQPEFFGSLGMIDFGEITENRELLNSASTEYLGHDISLT